MEFAHELPLSCLMRTKSTDGRVTVTKVMGSLCESWSTRGVFPLVKLQIEGKVLDDQGVAVGFMLGSHARGVQLDCLYQLRAERAGLGDTLQPLRDKVLPEVRAMLTCVDLSSAIAPKEG
jgi:hypothetical protein